MRRHEKDRDCLRCKVLEAEIERLKGSLSKFVNVKPITDADVLDRYRAGDNEREMGEALGVTGSTCGQRLRRMYRTIPRADMRGIEVERYRAMLARKAQGRPAHASLPGFRKEDLPHLPSDVLDHLKEARPHLFWLDSDD